MDKLFQEMRQRLCDGDNRPKYGELIPKALMDTTPFIRHLWFYTESPCNDWCEFAPLIKPTNFKIEIYSN